MAASQIYPLATQDGKAVPLDVAEPIALIYYPLVANTKKDITIPGGWTFMYVFSTCNCVLSTNDTDLPNTLVDGTTYNDAIFIPANTPVIITTVAGAGSISPLANGNIYLNKIEKWAALVQSNQSSFG